MERNEIVNPWITVDNLTTPQTHKNKKIHFNVPRCQMEIYLITLLVSTDAGDVLNVEVFPQSAT